MKMIKNAEQQKRINEELKLASLNVAAKSIELAIARGEKASGTLLEKAKAYYAWLKEDK
jgi:hypothetical protein